VPPLAGAAPLGHVNRASASRTSVADPLAEDARSSNPVERLLEESWEERSRGPNARKLVVESAATGLFLAVAVPWALPSLRAGHVPVGLATLLVVLYALVAETVRLPLGRGYVVPSYLMLVPMLLLLPASVVPLFAAGALLAGSLVRRAIQRSSLQWLVSSIPDAWHALGPALVLTVAGPTHGAIPTVLIYLGALLAGCLLDLVVSTVRESVALAVAAPVQIRVVRAVWLIDACVAPLGVLLAIAARESAALLLIVLPLIALLGILDRDRSARIAEAQRRFALVVRERKRLQAAVRRLGAAFAAKLDLPAVAEIVLSAAVEALDADAGRLTLQTEHAPGLCELVGANRLGPTLQAAGQLAETTGERAQIEQRGLWAFALPFAPSGQRRGVGSLALARSDREFREDECALIEELVAQARTAVTEILAHEALREQAVTDPLTQLGNRRKLSADLGRVLSGSTSPTSDPIVLMLFDLDGFKSYNDTFGHLAGDALLARLGVKLGRVVAPRGAAYRLGGDEFCVLVPATPEELHDAVTAAAAALEERGETFTVRASCGVVLLPHEASTAESALQLADERMYARKRARPSAVREQTRDVLIRIMQAKQPQLTDYPNRVARLAVAIGRRFALTGEEIDELARAAELHDIGKVGIPDAILYKAGGLESDEWEFIRQHSVLGERILNAAPALRPVAAIVRATHERWDGHGYPDRLRGEQIPLAARIIAVCDAYEAITTDRCYRKAQTPDAARQELEIQAGTQFDPAVVATFIEELDRPQPPAGPSPTQDHAARQIADELVQRYREMVEQQA
jgi:diguanylate cyclase (GGDEF)-like protein